MSKSTCCGADVIYDSGIEFCDDCGREIGKDLEARLYKDNDTVNHPSHYTAGKVECIDAIESATAELTGIAAV